jgi:crotonobetainyl-CoA hydratase
VNEATGVRLERRGPILEVTIDHPPANAIDVTTSRALGAAFGVLRDDDELRVGILTGNGERFFCAGGDLKSVASGAETNADHGAAGFTGLTERFDLDKPILAAVNGIAAGAGFEMALACDLIIAVEHAEFFLPELHLGLVADAGGPFRLPRRLPHAIAMELLLTGRRMSAAEAARWGLINKVVPASRLQAETRALAERIATAAPLAVAALKQLLRATEHLSVEQAFAVMKSGTLPAVARMLASDDLLEGARAFTEQRPPRFEGR